MDTNTKTGLSSRVLRQVLFFEDICRLKEYALTKNLAMTGGELERTPYQQAQYVRSGRSKTLLSNHIDRCALDAHFYHINSGKYVTEEEILKDLGRFWESLSPKNRWGGNFKSLHDTPHFERMK